MKTLKWCLIYTAFLSTSVWANTHPVHSGKMLFNDAHCMSCHASRPFNGEYSKIQTLADLQKRVRLCNDNLKVGWFDEEIHEVSHYLNKTYYHFQDDLDASLKK